MGNVCARDADEQNIQDQPKDEPTAIRPAQPAESFVPERKAQSNEHSPQNAHSAQHEPTVTQKSTYIATKDLNMLHPNTKKVIDSVKPRDFKQYPELKEHYATPIERLKNTINADTYHGHVVRGVPHGWGAVHTKNGEYLEGVFDNGKPVSHLRKITLDGHDYAGEMQGDVRQGKGTLYKPDGSSVKCETWLGGKPSGSVEERDAGQKITFKGTRSDNGLYQGNCIVGLKDYSVEGNFKDSIPTGAVKKTYLDGRAYEGTLNKDMQEEGTGAIQFVDGRKFSGPFAKGLANGKGTFTSDTGKKIEQTWKDGKRSQ